MRSHAVAAILVGVMAAGCGGGSSGPAAGTERGPCYGNGTCNPGLECHSNLCVQPTASGAAGTSGTAGGTAGTMGAAGTSGAAGTTGAAGTGGVAGTTGAGGSTGGRGGTVGPGGSAAGAGGSSGGTGGSTGGTGGSVATPNCTDYCTAIMSSCMDTSAQYTTIDACQAACPALPVGTSADLSGNTLGCRYHLLLASAPATPTACATAGPSGGNVCGSNPCVPYCELVLANCPSAYATMPDCMAACSNFQMGTGNYSAAATGGNGNVYCYLAFAVLASMMPTVHCQHVVASSTFCR